MPLVRFVMRECCSRRCAKCGLHLRNRSCRSAQSAIAQRPGRRRKPTNRKSGYLPDALEAVFSLVGALPRPLAPAVRTRAIGRRLLKLRPLWKSGLFVWAFSTYIEMPPARTFSAFPSVREEINACSFSRHQHKRGMLFMRNSAVKDHIANRD